MVALGSPRPQTRSLNGRAYVASWHNATDADALIFMVGIGGTADIDTRVASANQVESDPTRT